MILLFVKCMFCLFVCVYVCGSSSNVCVCLVYMDACVPDPGHGRCDYF